MSALLRPGFWGALVLALFALSGAAAAKDDDRVLKTLNWSFEPPLGTFDRHALQRGFQIYKEVCSSCHSLNFVSLRTLGDQGGPGFSTAEVKAIAAAYQKDVLDDTGAPKQVPRTPADGFPAPFPSEQAARAANGGALPPDLSLITHAREGGANYVYSLLTGYKDPPPDVVVRAGLNYNVAFAGHQVAMPPPLSDGRVTYSDGTQASVDQMARDVATFLEWAADPKLEQRKRLGLNVLSYLAVLSLLLYWSYRKVWHGKH